MDKNQDQTNIQEQRRELPIFQFKQEIEKLVKENLFCIITGETGSGKSTQLAQFVIDQIRPSDLKPLDDQNLKERYGYSNDDLKNSIGRSRDPSSIKVVVTQPRRVAAIQMAKRVAFERSCKLGEEVGYTIRFEDKTDKHTQIKYVTDGILVRECLMDPNLMKYQVVILDEAHERSLNTDILFTLVKQAVLRRRGTLRLIITSATLKTNKISNFYFNCPLLSVSGRCYPVAILHNMVPKEQRIEASVDTAIRIHLHEPEGDILCFLTGFEECEKACRLTNERLQGFVEKKQKEIAPVMIVTLYGSQNPEQQANAFIKTPPNCRKIVYATNIAETSLTVDGIGYVIDCGLVKQMQYNPETGMESLQTVNISKVQSIQRAGRAGRTREGKCIRLYSEQFYRDSMPDQTTPEILRVSLTSTVLKLKSLGIDDVLGFDYMDRPKQEQLEESLKNLYFLEAVDKSGRITILGEELSKFPLNPAFAKTLLCGFFMQEYMNSKSSKVVGDVLKLVSVLSTENIWMNVSKSDSRGQESLAAIKRRFRDPEGDHFGLVEVYDAWYSEKQVSKFGELVQWCNKKHLQNRALAMAKDIKDQLSELMYKVESRLDKYFTFENYKPPKFSNSLEERSYNLRFCLATCFFMNACRIVPNKSEGTYLSVKEGIIMKLDTAQSLYKQGNFPQWVIYTEASGQDQSCIMRTSSSVDFAWIENKLNLLKNVDIQELCGEKQIEQADKTVGQKRSMEDSTISTTSDHNNKDKDEKLKLLQQRYQKRQKV